MTPKKTAKRRVAKQPVKRKPAKKPCACKTPKFVSRGLQRVVARGRTCLTCNNRGMYTEEGDGFTDWAAWKMFCDCPKGQAMRRQQRIKHRANRFVEGSLKRRTRRAVVKGS